VISEKALKTALGRFGITRVEEVLTLVAQVTEESRQKGIRPTPRGVVRSLCPDRFATERQRDYYQDRIVPVAEVLFQDSLESQANLRRLVTSINGVSEPATAPHQTPEARVTPGPEDEKF
jgi:hypothetical protein